MNDRLVIGHKIGRNKEVVGLRKWSLSEAFLICSTDVFVCE